MDAAGNDKALDIAYSNKDSKKVCKARKTMSASCRQQMASLGKIKNVSKMENWNELLHPPTEEAIQNKDTKTMCETNCMAQENSTEITPIEAGTKEITLSTEVAQDDSGLDSGCSYKEGTCEKTNGINENAASDAGSPVPLSSIGNDVNVASGNPKAHQQSDLNSISSVGESNLLAFEATKNCSQLNIDNNCSESTIPITMDKDCSLKTNSAVGLVTPMDVLYGNRISPADSHQEANISSAIGEGNTVAPNFTLDRRANSASNESSRDGDTASGKRKRSFSGDGEDPKRAKISNKIILNEVHNMIETRIHTVFKESFDQRMQDLSQQIGLIQSKGYHADSIAVHVRRIRRLGKRIKYAVEVQNEMIKISSNSQPVSAASDEPPQTQPDIISPRNLSAAESTIPHRENNSVQSQSTDSSNLVVLSGNESQQPSNPEKDKNANLKTPSKKLDNEAIRKILESIKEHRKKSLSSRMTENGKTIIDLTDDEEQKSNKDSQSAETVALPPMSVPAQENGSDPQKKKEESSAHLKDQRSCPVNEKTSSMPNSAQTVKAHDSATSVQSAPNPDACVQKPPQKPELRLAQVQNPKGIALSWNITQVDPSCAPAKVYCLYVNQENPNSTKKLWKKIGEIKALPLPMACTLTQFVDDATYSFALRAKDTFGRFGPLCDIQSTTLKSLTTLKKI